MEAYGIKKRDRFLYGFICILLIVFTVFASFYIASETLHECSGEECSVCICLKICEALLRAAGGVSFAAVSVFFLGSFTVFYSRILPGFVFGQTLVSRKIRLND